MNESEQLWQHAPDAELIEGCLRGEPLAWDVLIGRYSGLIYSIPLRFGLTRMVADEIFQEVCVTLLRKLDQLQDQARVASWLGTVTRRACIHYLRRQKETEELEGDFEADDPTIEQDLMRLEQAQRVRVALARLPERCRTMLQLLFFQQPPPEYEELAEILGIKVGSVGPIRRRCLDRLQRELVE